jgi:tetratricopeptide (TPR) repeat protein
LPYLFIGWLWYAITILPVLGITYTGVHWIHDLYTYLPSIGIAFMLAWGIPSLIRSDNIRKKILFPAAIAVLAVLAFLTWQQCGYWKNSINLWNHALKVTKDNYLAHNSRGIAYGESGEYQRAIDDFNKAIDLKTDYFKAFNNRGFAYAKLGQYQRAIKDYGEAIRLKPDYTKAYTNRAIVYLNQGNNISGCNDARKACVLKFCATLEEAKIKGYCN